MSKKFYSLAALALTVLLSVPMQTSAQLPVTFSPQRSNPFHKGKEAKMAKEKQQNSKFVTLKSLKDRPVSAIQKVRTSSTAPFSLRKPAQGLRLNANGSTFWVNRTWVSGDSQGDLIGVYSVNTANIGEMSPLLLNPEFYMRNGVQATDGYLYGAELFSFWGMYFPMLHTANTDSWTAETIGFQLDDFSLIGNETAQAVDGSVYGQFYNAEGSAIELCVVDYATLSRTVIAPANVQMLIMGITNDNRLYGIDYEGNLYQIDTSTGVETLVGSTGVETIADAEGNIYYQTGEIDPATNIFYWLHANAVTGEIIAYTVDLETGKATAIQNLGEQQLEGMVFPPMSAAPKAPAKVNDLTIEYDGKNNFVTFTAPTTTMNGDPFDGAMAYVVTNGVDTLAQGLTHSGEKKRICLEMEDGLNRLTVTTQNAWGKSGKTSVTAWAGYDVPAAPQNVTLAITDEGVVTLNWDAVTKGIHGGSVGDITYDVYIVKGEDKELVAEGLTETSYTGQITIGGMANHVFGVVAKGESFESDLAQSNGVVKGSSVEVPYLEDFASEGSLNLFTIIDANADGYSWDWSNGYMSCPYNSLDNTVEGDDWLITPPVKLQAGRSYTFTVVASCRLTSYPERLEVMMGTDKTVEAMTTEVIGSTDITSDEDLPFTNENVTVDADGEYYFGIHSISDADMFYLYVDAISIEANPLAEAPAAVADLTVVPDQEGEAKATVKFTAPAKNIGGEDLTANITKIDVYRDNNVVKTFEDVAPGTEIEFVDEATDGIHAYKVLCYNEAGNGKMSEVVSTYMGLDVPAAVTNLNGKDNKTSVTLTWDKVGTVGLNGGVVKPELVDYIVWSLDEDGYLDEQLDSLRDNNTSTFDFVTNEGDQTLTYWCVETKNKQGEGGYSTNYLFTGRAYDMPFVEPFANNTLACPTWYFDSSEGVGSSAGFYWSDESSNNDGSSVNAICDNDGQWMSATPGKIALQAGATNPTYIFDYKYEDAENSISMEVRRPNGEIVSIDVPTIADGQFHTAKVNLSALNGEEYIVPYLKFNYANAGEFFLDNIFMFDLYEYNLSVALKAPANVSVGKKATFNVTVQNFGDNEATDYSVKVLVGDEEIALDQTEFPALASMETAEFTASVTPDIFSDFGKKTVKAEVVYDLDLEPNDNVAEASINVVAPDVAGPEGVVVDGNTVTWTAPSSVTSTVTEDFENQEIFEPFSLGGITAENHLGGLGDWTLYDADGTIVYGFSGITLPNVGEPSSFMPFNSVAIYGEENGTGLYHSGVQCLTALNSAASGVIPPSDNWLISPELPGVAQTISFYVSQISSTDQSATSFYGYETYEVLYSSTDTELASFTKLGDYSVTTNDWTEITVSLPAGAKYFAIRHTSTDIFGFMVDDITYVVSGGEIAGYNIYADKTQIGSVAGNVYTFTSSQSLEGHQVAVTAVYSNGIESLPAYAAAAKFDITPIERILSTGEPFDIYNLNGMLLREQTTTVEGLKPGIYVVNGMKVIIK